MSTIAPIAEQIEKNIDFKHIVIATDFSTASKRALAHAATIARRYGAELSLVHAICPEPRQPVSLDPLPREVDRQRLEAEQKLRQLDEESHLQDLRHHTLLQRGSVWDLLHSILEHDDIDLLVLGTHGRGGLKKLALGSIAEEVLRLATCPVLTVGPNASAPKSDVADYKSILFATDFGTASANAFKNALFLAGARAKLTLFHTVPPTAIVDIGPAAYCPGTCAAGELSLWQSRTREESLRKLRALVPSNANLANEPEYVVASESLSEGILAAAAACQAELIVMGANRARSARLAAHVPWTVTHDILCQAKCPVLTVGN
jgi:nucleotide-binding universal stress UspA family protein